VSPELDELLKRAMALPPEDRAAMANSLLESLDETEDEDAEAAWGDEIKHRVDDIRSGRVKTIPGEQVLARLNALRRDAASIRAARWFNDLDEFSGEPFTR
jgi:putative addiction module component (TIGR02574 family)